MFSMATSAVVSDDTTPLLEARLLHKKTKQKKRKKLLRFIKLSFILVNSPIVG
jgi:hypothetical protein